MSTFLPEVLKGHIASLGVTGSGKTSTSKLVVEHDYDMGTHVCIFDPVKSDWRGLVSDVAGTGPGLPFVILGGPYGYVPLHHTAGAQIAALVASGELKYSILDTRKFPPGGLQKFWNDFAPVLLDHNEVVLRLVLEEAHELAPKEKSGVGGENMAVYHAKKIATAGRSQGIRLLVNTQRVQSLHNALLGACGTILAHRLNLPADQEPVFKWIRGSVKDPGMRAEMEHSIPELADGEAWYCSPQHRILRRIQMPRIRTFDNSDTPTGPRSGVKAFRPQIDVEALRAKLGTVVAEAEANDVDALKAQIKELIKERDSGWDRGQVVSAREEGKQDGERLILDRVQMAVDAFKDPLAAVEALDAELRDMAYKVGGLAGTIRDVIGMLKLDPTETSPQKPPSLASVMMMRELPAYLEKSARLKDAVLSPAPAREPDVSRISPSASKILEVVRNAAPLWISFSSAATRAGISKLSSAYPKYRKEVLEQAKRIHMEVDGDRMRARHNDGGKPNGNVREFVDGWARKLPPSTAAMLLVIFERGPLSKLEIADRAGVSPTSSGLGQGLKDLREMGLIETDGNGYVMCDGLRRGGPRVNG